MSVSAVASFVCLTISVCILSQGPHVSSAQMTGGHDAVKTMMCTDLPKICPCNANNLQIIASNSLVCGATQTRTTMSILPVIKPPTGVSLDQNVLYTVLIIDRDASSRQFPLMRYWVHGLFTDITAADLSKGNIAKGTVLTSYMGPSPPLHSGAHSYQVLLLAQDPKVGGNQMQGAPTTSRGQFKVQTFLITNKMCGDGQLIGAFEFHCSNPDGADPKNPERQCPDPPVALSNKPTTSDNVNPTNPGRLMTIVPLTVGAGGYAESTTQDNYINYGYDETTLNGSITLVTKESTSGTSGYGSFLHALVSVIMLRILL